MGQLGAIAFWERFNTDQAFREEMHEVWQRQRFDKNQKRKAARKGAVALWQRYYSDPEFKKALDQKLKASRIKGGSRSLLNIGERDFKRRLAASASSRSWPAYHDSNGNLLRSLLETRVAKALHDGGISYLVERRLVVPGHAFYPDFTLDEGQRLIEVVGFAADWYWDKTAEKVELIVENHNHVQIGIVTPFQRMMKRRLKGVPRVAFFTPYQLEQLTRWCRGMPGFTSL